MAIAYSLDLLDVFCSLLDKCKLIKGPKPLTHFKFYLDIEKHQLQSKIEKAIQELGGVSFLLNWADFKENTCKTIATMS